MTELVFVDDTYIPVEGDSSQEVEKNLQKAALTWKGVLRNMGVTLRPDNCF